MAYDLGMPTRNVTLSEHLDRFIEDGLESGRFQDVNEMVTEGLKLLEAREEQAKLEWFRAAAKEGFDAIERGDYVRLNSAKEVKDFLEEIGKEAAAELADERNRV